MSDTKNRIYNIRGMEKTGEHHRIQAKYHGLYDQFKTQLPRKSQLISCWFQTNDMKEPSEHEVCTRWPKAIVSRMALLKPTAKKDMDSIDQKYGSSNADYDLLVDIPQLCSEIERRLNDGEERFTIPLVAGVSFEASYQLGMNKEEFLNDLRDLYCQYETRRGISFETMGAVMNTCHEFREALDRTDMDKVTIIETKDAYGNSSYELKAGRKVFKLYGNICDDLKKRHPMLKTIVVKDNNE